MWLRRVAFMTLWGAACGVMGIAIVEEDLSKYLLALFFFIFFGIETIWGPFFRGEEKR